SAVPRNHALHRRPASESIVEAPILRQQSAATQRLLIPFTQEIERRGRVKSSRCVDQPIIEILQKKCAKSRDHREDSTRSAGASKAAEEILIGPCQGHARSAQGAAVDFRKAAKEVAMTQVRESCEIVSSHMALLHKGSLRIYHTTRT